MLEGQTYDSVCRNFRWKIPETYNIGVDVCDKWANGSKRLALIYVGPDEKEQRFSFQDLKALSNKLANALRANGMEKGDRVGIFLPQCPETLLSHIAVYKLGCIALPLLTLFGPMALEYRLRDSGAKAVITNSENLTKIMDIRDRLPDLKLIMVVGDDSQSVYSFRPPTI